MEEDEGARRGLLLASISESASRSIPIPALKLPAFKLALPGTSPRAASASGKPTLHQQRSPRGPSPKQLAHAGAELVVVMGAGLIAAVSQVLAKARPGARSGSHVPFHQSFKLPWSGRNTEAKR
jgi:hypothetical protein